MANTQYQFNCASGADLQRFHAAFAPLCFKALEASSRGKVHITAATEEKWSPLPTQFATSFAENFFDNPRPTEIGAIGEGDNSQVLWGSWTDESDRCVVFAHDRALMSLRADYGESLRRTMHVSKYVSGRRAVVIHLGEKDAQQGDINVHIRPGEVDGSLILEIEDQEGIIPENAFETIQDLRVA